MSVMSCSARVVLFSPNLDEGLAAKRAHPEYSHALVISAGDPSALNRMKGRTFAGWVLLPGVEHRSSARRLQELIERARRFACGCSQHFPGGEF